MIMEIARLPPDEVFHRVEGCPSGLRSEEAAARRDAYGPNLVAQGGDISWWMRLVRAMLNPLVVLLVVLAISSCATGDYRAGLVMLAMVALGVILRFVQESRADKSAAKLRRMIQVHATVLRDGVSQEVPIDALVPGDVVELSAGDMIPADVRLVAAKDLFVVQSSLTGESFPVEKFVRLEANGASSALELCNVCFLGTSVERGTGRGVVVTIGRETYLGGMSAAIASQHPPTSFDRGVDRFTWFMIGLIAVMVPLVFLINGFLKRNWDEAFFFSMAVGVGLTPEMLPMIVAVCLSKGALAMSRKRVIVRRLNSIQNLGAMDVLCTDKTGTLTLDQIILEKHCDVALKEDPEVLKMAYLNSHFQTGLRNVLDRAILQHADMKEHVEAGEFEKVDEIPFDFSRRVMSVVVGRPDKPRQLICKGAPEEVYRRCRCFQLDGALHPLDLERSGRLKEEFAGLSRDGFRVLALAYKEVETKGAYSTADEEGLILRGYLAFLDPPKGSARGAIAALNENGIRVKVLTGDNELLSRKVCHDVGIDTERLLLGADVERMSDEELQSEVMEATLFARMSPAHKQRVIQALQRTGHVVGYLGDGINDAPAMHACDVGISVDTAVDIARESADLILLEKDLTVLKEGVQEGRKVFANILKYIRMGASSNFGNIFSVVGASVILPYVPMSPLQILTNNLLYDVSQVPIPTDEVDEEQIQRPRQWSMHAISRFILLVGPCSSIFDYTTFFVLLWGFGCWDPRLKGLFQTGWFVESLLTQTLIIHVIRTNRIPFLQSRASWPLCVTTAFIMGLGIWLPFSAMGGILGFVPLPWSYWPVLAITLAGYVVLTQTVKMWLLRKHWIEQ